MFYQIIRRILQPFILILMMIGGKKGEFLKKKIETRFFFTKKRRVYMGTLFISRRDKSF